MQTARGSQAVRAQPGQLQPARHPGCSQSRMLRRQQQCCSADLGWPACMHACMHAAMAVRHLSLKQSFQSLGTAALVHSPSTSKH